MSRIGEVPVEVPAGVTVSVDGGSVVVKGAKGELTQELPAGITVEVEDGSVTVKRADDSRKAFHGLIRSLIANMVVGVSAGYKKELEIQGVGFKAELKGKTLNLSLGFASPIEYAVPDTVTITLADPTKIAVEGIDKQQVGLVAARIRSFYPAEPYKGKGVRYKGEKVRRKEGKTVA
jgi:large subunit ribosomal protein L6